MNILMKKPGIMMIDQYGSKYIRFIAGEINDSILQCRITEDEAAKIQGEELTMESVLNYYDNQGDCSPGNLQDALLKDYLRTVSEYSEQRINRIVEKLKTHGDIFFEFYDYVLYEKFVDDGITIEGFTAEYLANNYPLSPLGAYNYLIYLREMPEKALADLKAGLPSRDSTYREVGNQQKEEQSSMEEKVPVQLRRQKIIQTVPTDDQSKDNLVAVRVADGYEKAGKVLRPERIKIFKYSSTTTDTTEN